MLETRHNAWRDFTSITTLCRRAGCSAGELPMTAVKEILDNALDVSPTGLFDFTVYDDAVMIHDRGPGLSEDKMLELFNVSRDALSSKRWRQARRGALGNGLRVVMGIMYVLEGALMVESRGLFLELNIGPDGSTIVTERDESNVTEGTCITLHFKQSIDVVTFDRYIERTLAGAGVAFGGTKAVPQWFDRPTVYELMRDVDPDTSALVFAQQFDLTGDMLAAVKKLYARKTVRDLLFDDEARGILVTSILEGGKKPPRELKRMGRNALEGAYAFSETMFELGGLRLPVIIEAWTKGEPVKDRKTQGKAMIETIYANRTPALQSKTFGTVHCSDNGIIVSLFIGNSSWTVTNVIKGPCNFQISVAITSPELPIISEGKAVDFTPFEREVCNTIAETLKRAYVKPLQTLAETEEENPKELKPKKEPKPIRKPKPKEPPHQPGTLGKVFLNLALDTCRDPDALRVLSKDYDPYTLDTRPNRNKAEWLRDVMQQAGIWGRPIHIRGIYYALVSHGSIRRPDGKPFTGSYPNWLFVQRIARQARWMEIVPWNNVIDERNTPPKIRYADTGGSVQAQIIVSAPGVEKPDDDGRLDVYIDPELPFPRRRQPFNLVLLGEKTGLEPVLDPLAVRFGASLFLPSGEPSITMVRELAEFGATDGRRMIVFTFTDFDPVGNNIPATVARRLQAFRDLDLPALDFEVRPVMMTEALVRSLGLPSTPLKPKEARAPAWKARFGGLEQTEVDALATLQPETFARIAEQAIAPFFDTGLAARQREAEGDWKYQACLKVMDVDKSPLDGIRERMAEGARKIEAAASDYNAAAAEFEKEGNRLVEGIEFGAFVPPEPETAHADAPSPLVSSDMDSLSFIDRLREHMIRKNDDDD